MQVVKRVKHGETLGRHWGRLTTMRHIWHKKVWTVHEHLNIERENVNNGCNLVK